jgi:vacuolar-type H+-ATPase subunit C/Vma6
MKYLFFVAWLRAKEKKLADKVDFARMIGASSSQETFKILNDTDYAPCLTNKTPDKIEEIIEEEKEELKKNFSLMGLDKKTLDFLFLEDEFPEIEKNYQEYLEKMINFCEKDKQALSFFKEYQKINQSEKDFSERDRKLAELEEDFIEKSEYQSSGIMPLLAFLFKKKRAQYSLRTIFAAKKLGMDSSQTNELISSKRVL